MVVTARTWSADAQDRHSLRMDEWERYKVPLLTEDILAIANHWEKRVSFKSIITAKLIKLQGMTKLPKLYGQHKLYVEFWKMRPQSWVGRETSEYDQNTLHRILKNIESNFKGK